MTFNIDKHDQLRIQASYDLSAAEPDTLVLTREQTEELVELLSSSQEKFKK